MDTILNYLDNMFLNLPRTAGVMRAKAELAAMMEDKYQELLSEGKSDNEAVGIVISEFGNLSELAEELGIDEAYGDEQLELKTKRISDTEANQYLELNQRASKGFGVGTMLCIFSPVILMVLAGLKEGGYAVSDAVLVCGGVIPLLCIIAVAVGFFIYYGTRIEKYEYMKKQTISISPEVEKYVRSRWNEVERLFLVKLIVGVIMCILSVIPLLIVGGVLYDNDMYSCFMVAIMLVIIGTAVYFIVSGSMEKEALEVLLQEGEFTLAKKEDQKVGSVYWPLVTCIYLLWSFLTGDWGITWLIWPIAGLLFAVITPEKINKTLDK